MPAYSPLLSHTVPKKLTPLAALRMVIAWREQGGGFVEDTGLPHRSMLRVSVFILLSE